MRLHTLFKEVLTREIPMDEKEKADLAADLEREYQSIQTSETYLTSLKEEGKVVPIKTRIKLFTENVYVRVGLAIAYLAIIRWVRELKNPRPENNENGHDDDDDF